MSYYIVPFQKELEIFKKESLDLEKELTRSKALIRNEQSYQITNNSPQKKMQREKSSEYPKSSLKDVKKAKNHNLIFQFKRNNALLNKTMTKDRISFYMKNDLLKSSFSTEGQKSISDLIERNSRILNQTNYLHTGISQKQSRKNHSSWFEKNKFLNSNNFG